MLTSIRIQNFRSIRDAQVKLGQVNLFIGPNNSGKSNFLKGVEFSAKKILNYQEGQSVDFELYNQIIPRAMETNPFESRFISVCFNEQVSKEKICECNLSIHSRHEFGSDKGTVESKIEANLINLVFDRKEKLELNLINSKLIGIPQIFLPLWNRLKKVNIYKPDPSKFHLVSQINNENAIMSDGSNIISFLYNLRENYRKNYQQLEESFAYCVGTLTTVSMPLNPQSSSTFKLRFGDDKGLDYWAEEVSEGVLYFLALLCVIHQPDPPKLLLLEEPEKGIHPRRIREVMDFIFELARLRDIQIILTSHSPYVVDHFADIPECISVFDRENGETVIRNAADIIAETNATLKQPIRYSDALGEHWVSGFLGGVPL